ncbi:MAG: hypothetical protein DCC71_23900, partial [Proteobacteria bacterium]
GREAVARARRPLAGRASEKARAAVHEARAGADPMEDGAFAPVAAPRSHDLAGMEIATEVGTAVHELLEHFAADAGEDDAGEDDWEARLATLRDALARRVAPARLAAAVARAEQALAALRDGELGRRWRALAPHGIARELEVLLPGETEGEGAIGCVIGAIDWIYRDPATGDVVVVDFKTDAVRTRADVAARVAGYRIQADRYRRAAQEALGLPRPPRVELWFLAADRSEAVEPEAGSREA